MAHNLAIRARRVKKSPSWGNLQRLLLHTSDFILVMLKSDIWGSGGGCGRGGGRGRSIDWNIDDLRMKAERSTLTRAESQSSVLSFMLPSSRQWNYMWMADCLSLIHI